MEDDTLMYQDYLPKKSLTCWSCVYGPPISSSGDLIINRWMEVPLGSPVSPLVVNIYMEMFEELSLRMATHPSQIWRRHVNDTFCMITKMEVKVFLSHLNSLHPTITFTVEKEEEGKLPFLDTYLHRKNDGSLDISVYRKPTHTDQYLNFSSHHPCHM